MCVSEEQASHDMNLYANCQLVPRAHRFRPALHFRRSRTTVDKPHSLNMISDDDLYRLAVVLGSAAMVLIVVYHFVEINFGPKAQDKAPLKATSGSKAAPK